MRNRAGFVLLRIRTLSHFKHPFGAYALPDAVERRLEMASSFPANRFGRLMTSVLRRVCLLRKEEPFDISVFPTICARLFPSTNRCEKRLIAGPQFFDLPEREALTEALQASGSDPFVFLDLGANVGFYSLWTVAQSRQLGQPVRIIAVEPDRETRRRLEFNIAASGAQADITVRACGIGAESGWANMTCDARNRGANTIALTAEDVAGSFEVVPLLDLCRRNDIERIDALKIDIEGHDYAALEAFFASGVTELYPEMIIAEVGRKKANPPLIRLCRENGYKLHNRTQLNAILTRSRTQAEFNG
jgi:FkbM family methyltransferase